MKKELEFLFLFLFIASTDRIYLIVYLFISIGTGRDEKYSSRVRLSVRVSWQDLREGQRRDGHVCCPTQERALLV